MSGFVKITITFTSGNSKVIKLHGLKWNEFMEQMRQQDGKQIFLMDINIDPNERSCHWSEVDDKYCTYIVLNAPTIAMIKYKWCE